MSKEKTIDNGKKQKNGVLSAIWKSEDMSSSSFWREAYAYLLVIVGSALFAVGDVMFSNPYLLAPGGTWGLSNVLSTVFGWQISITAICMDIPLLIIGTIILGPKFGVKTVVSTILIFVFAWILEHTWGYNPVVHIGDFVTTQPADLTDYNLVPHSNEDGGTGLWFKPDYVINTLVTGLIYGAAIGLIFRSGATSGGSDIISMIIHKYTKISLGTLVMIVDGCITLSTFIAFKEVRLPIYSIVVIAIESFMIDLIVDGLKTHKTMFIVTDKVDTVRNYIINDLKRGGTCFSGTGLFNGVERKMVYVTLERADMVKLRSHLYELDPDAFVNVMNSSEILGKGFKALPKE